MILPPLTVAPAPALARAVDARAGLGAGPTGPASGRRPVWTASWPGRLLASLVVFCGLLLLWHLLATLLRIPVYLLPKPGDVAGSVWRDHAKLLNALRITSLEAVGGLAGSIVAGVLLALVFALSPPVRRLFYPYTILLQTVPIVAIAPLIINWLRPGTHSVMLVTFIICLFPIIANATQGLVSVERNFLHLFAMHRAAGWQVLWKLRLPHALPSLFTGVRISSGISVIGAITGELFAGTARVGEGGLGYSITYANSQLQTPYLFALVLASTVLGFSFFFAVIFLEWWFLHRWHESALRPESE